MSSKKGNRSIYKAKKIKKMNYLRGDQLVKNREGMVFNQLQYTHNNTYMHAYIYEEIVKLFSKTPVKSRFIERRKNKKEREREKK